MSAHYLTSDNLYLKHAEDLGQRLVATFNTSSGLPQPVINLSRPQVLLGSYTTSPAEAGSLQLEFKYLAELTKNESYWHKAEKAISVIQKGLLPNGLAPTKIRCVSKMLYNSLIPNHRNRIKLGTFQSSVVRLGSAADSYYEYLL